MLTDVDLPAPGLLWTRWATLGAALTSIGRAAVWSIDDRGATHDDGDGGWARFALLDGRRAVLYGHHREHSATTHTDPPLDLLTGAPDWLPWADLSPLAENDRLGFVIWHESGRWSRVRYRDGLLDGMTDLLAPLLTAEKTITALSAMIPGGTREAASILLTAGVRAELTTADLEALLGDVADGEAALGVAARGGLLPGTRAPRIAPGKRPPMRRVRRLSQGEHDRLVWAAMHDAAELRRPAPPATGELDALVSWLQDRAPHGDGRCTLLAYADATSFSSQPGERPPADRPDEERFAAFRALTELVRALRRAESDPRYGRWLFLRVETTATGVTIERRYDSWPPWWHDDGVSGPWRTNLQEEMDARLPPYRPSWVRLLDPEVAYRPTS
ncbi:hypothetical protein AMIS_67460 [Actinoplanes missouriensis 431]|uniref:Uncharacterized protein n=1 Tax=Actinoplanes missouriensis (strain ATCC 14538 / DSM 43046 / CBS 188.64 / JCM 3121 / NBRC 102363 / NCIMB 12654 / NRRL B-3342 / UNCC 431) TaxID=512565 RepID=I0HG29_ACTM4|nr:hypothetical protein [Actinoplanes missouriensis]BAL91966.1 hypothetical protein AMIS_67460 [Actinoplanes missouriensis 431]